MESREEDMVEESEADPKRPSMDKSAKKGLVPGPSVGTVRSFTPGRNPFGGFITDERTGIEIFVHKTAVQSAGFEKLVPGERVNFVIIEDGFGGFKAVNLSRPG
jgi:cold shock CspA family protein